MVTPRENWYDVDAPEVSVIILNFNKSDLTKKCLESVWENTFGFRYEIVVVDNGSTPDEVRALVDAGSHFRLIKLPENYHFGDGSNIGAQHSRGRYLVFLNNDAFVRSNWLKPLIHTLENYPDAGAAGSRFFSPDGQLQEVGGFINEVGQNIQVGTIKPYHPREEFETRIVDYCSAACLALSKKLFDELGGFDPIYSPAYFEDVDICFKIAAKHRFVYYCPESIVVHIRNATSNTVWNAAELVQLVEKNRQTFLSRWGHWLRARTENRAAPFPTFEPSPAT
jgi:GT2 family glycosyltransferase